MLFVLVFVCLAPATDGSCVARRFVCGTSEMVSHLDVRSFLELSQALDLFNVRTGRCRWPGWREHTLVRQVWYFNALRGEVRWGIWLRYMSLTDTFEEFLAAVTELQGAGDDTVAVDRAFLDERLAGDENYWLCVAAENYCDTERLRLHA